MPAWLTSIGKSPKDVQFEPGYKLGSFPPAAQLCQVDLSLVRREASDDEGTVDFQVPQLQESMLTIFLTPLKIELQKVHQRRYEIRRSVCKRCIDNNQDVQDSQRIVQGSELQGTLRSTSDHEWTCSKLQLEYTGSVCSFKALLQL